MSTPTITRMNVAREEKHCSGCDQTLPREAFPLKAKTEHNRDRRWPVCSDCLPEYRRLRAEKQAETSAARSRRRRSMVPVEREQVPQLPTGPIREWLIEQLGVPTVEESPHLGPDEQGRVREVAQWLNVTDRQVHRWRSGEAKKTSLDLLDAAFCHAGQPWKLRELYPALYKPSRTWMHPYPASCIECQGPCLGYDPSVFDYEDAEEQMAS